MILYIYSTVEFCSQGAEQADFNNETQSDIDIKDGDDGLRL